MKLVCAMLLGFVLDLIFGDPHGLVHPVQIIGWFIDKLNSLAKKYTYGTTASVGCIVWGLYGYPGEVMKRKEFEKIEIMNFCKYKMPVFSCWNKYLIGCYGDYMKMPDIDKRYTHKYRAFIE